MVMARWVRNKEHPPMGMPLQMAGADLARDENMNVLGGVRLPDLDAPTKTYTADNGPTDPLDFIGLLACGLAGTAVPFTPEKLMQLYPTHEDYVQKYTAAADEALAAGFLLKADYDEMLELARAARFRSDGCGEDSKLIRRGAACAHTARIIFNSPAMMISAENVSICGDRPAHAIMRTVAVETGPNISRPSGAARTRARSTPIARSTWRSG